MGGFEASLGTGGVSTTTGTVDGFGSSLGAATGAGDFGLFSRTTGGVAAATDGVGDGSEEAGLLTAGTGTAAAGAGGAATGAAEVLFATGAGWGLAVADE